ERAVGRRRQVGREQDAPQAGGGTGSFGDRRLLGQRSPVCFDAGEAHAPSSVPRGTRSSRFRRLENQGTCQRRQPCPASQSVSGRTTPGAGRRGREGTARGVIAARRSSVSRAVVRSGP